MPASSARRSFRDFLDRLRAFESGIDPDLHDWYVANLDVPVVECPVTVSPGRVVRDPETGEHRVAVATVADYFRSLGVLDHFDPADRDSLRRMQYRSMNAWGYVGYQIGEEVLRDIGYYEPARTEVEIGGRTVSCPVIHIGGLPAAGWAGGCEERLVEDPAGGLALATDVNRWQGRFLGRNGVASLEDLMEPELQEVAMVENIASNLRIVRRGLEAAGLSLADRLAMHWTAPGGGAAISCTLSGIVASCHLCGAGATLGLLLGSTVPSDALGTTALDYLARFGDYEIEEAEPGRAEVRGTR